ncbi:nucleotidyltransferase [Acidianus hospitalis]|jgi:predicted nucleotidyltransferase|uniref:Nucleotidyltransferase n=2 Tax=Acidianus hospitalis TaxID=563177 RepID=A0A2T9X276_9CREN|nr:nucleotidyltransferase [Acidianus hospitalis]AEE93531.1 DNA polymerase beta domain protein region [Acidianus hospitalis W1]PVU74187.1 nucleotidyltransferase [Acidianus hospitalis]
MGRDYFLDKDIIKDKNDNLYVVITNYNPPGYVFAYLKYVYTGEGLWKGYERVFKKYGVKNLIKIKQNFEYEPCYGSTFPVLKISEIKNHFKPEDKIKEIIHKPANKLEETVINMLAEMEVNLPLDKIGVTGSLLAGISHENSDVDLVIYGKKYAEDFVNTFRGFEEDKDWIIETSENYSLPIEVVKTIYSKKTRGKYKGVKYSFLFVDDHPWKYNEKVCIEVNPIKAIGENVSDYRALFYPSISTLYSQGKTFNIVSYEGIYSLALYYSKKIEAFGMLMKCEDELEIVIGDKKIGGYIRPIM